MESSEEEGEIVSDLVDEYYLIDNKKAPISFSVLPFRRSLDEIPNGLTPQILLFGTNNHGKTCKEVVAWKFELSYAVPEILLLSKRNVWIKLQRPRKSFENTIRTILITIRCLHFIKKNPEASKDALWNHLRGHFRSYEIKPSENDLLEHIPLIKNVAAIDRDIQNSKLLATFLTEMEKPQRIKTLHEESQTRSKPKFIVYDDDDDDDDDCGEDDDDKIEELFDSVCAICDNGGDILPCEGRCIRSFHPTVAAGVESSCKSLGFAHASQYEAIQTFLCDNCKYQQHQCFVCAKLGSSDMGSGAEVFPCVSATCGHFYHPKCVAELVHPLDKTQAEKLHMQIAAGESFTCPAHKCAICKQGENKAKHDLQFAVCRRCPKAYHRKCLPRKISFSASEDGSVQERAWDNLLPKRILIYCMAHKIIPSLGTPSRDHIVFPYSESGKKQETSLLPEAKQKMMFERRNMNFEDHKNGSAEKKQKLIGRPVSAIKYDDSAFEKGGSVKSPKDKDTSISKQLHKSSSMHQNKSTFKDETSVSKQICNSSPTSKIKLVLKCKDSKFLVDVGKRAKIENVISAEPTKKKEIGTQPSVNTDFETRMLKFIKDSTASFNEDEFIKQRKKECTHGTYTPQSGLDKTITIGKIEASLKALKAALNKLEQGYSVEDAKVVCEPQVLDQLMRWKRRLRVYLAPFLHGPRYTSFGRHFTKADKLKEIVDRLHWYVEDGDMIVDFSCGSNDFSCIMEEKLQEMGKKCSFKNYDLIPPKNTFAFEKRDWFTIRKEELPDGSRLIMGLNPPFGTHAALANKFIHHALKFKPKLLILIVPKETKRLDDEKHPYDIIWEDDQIVSGKSFYLPGSVDVHDVQVEQWNTVAPPLYLWSRPDYTAKHKAIAEKHCHIRRTQVERNEGERVVSNYLMEEKYDCYGDFSNIMANDPDFSSIFDDVPEEPIPSSTENRFVPEEPIPFATETEHFPEEQISSAMEGEFRETAHKGAQEIQNHEMPQIEVKPYGEKNVDKDLSTPVVASSVNRRDFQSSGPSATGFGYPQIAVSNETSLQLPYSTSDHNAYASVPNIHPTPLASYGFPGQHLIQPPATSYGHTGYMYPNSVYPPGSSYGYSSQTYIQPPPTRYGHMGYPPRMSTDHNDFGDIRPPGT